jgi:hypothetical protein
MEADWARAVRDQCRAAGIPFFMRAMHSGEYVPPDLQIREFPKWEDLPHSTPSPPARCVQVVSEVRAQSSRKGIRADRSLQIIIPTRGRVYQQLTLQSLPPELRKQTTLVCPKREASELYRLYKDVVILVQPDPNWTIAQKRAWIMPTWLEAGHTKIIMLDDDLHFATRVSENDTRLRSMRPEELLREFERLADKLGPEYPHVGFGPRKDNHTKDPGWEIADRMIYSLAYYLPVVVEECELGRIETREDMDLTLQLLRKGFPNAVWNSTVTNQRYNAPGGATNERTVESSNADALKLEQLHPGYVRVDKKAYKTSVPRLEVRCSWKKALDDA